MSRLFIIVCIDNFQCTRTLLLRSHKITKSDECTLPIAVAFPKNESANRHSSTFEAGIFQLNQRTDVFLSDNPLTHLLIGRYEHPHVRSHEAKLSMFGNQIKQPVNECSEEICFAILIMVLHELFELDAHILCTHIWRVRHHCRVFTRGTLSERKPPPRVHAEASQTMWFRLQYLLPMRQDQQAPVAAESANRTHPPSHRYSIP